MKKKIMAMTVSLLMAASAAPIAEIHDVLPSGFSLSASAADGTGTYEISGIGTATLDPYSNAININADQYFANYVNKSEVTINLSAAKTALQNQGVDISGYDIVLNGVPGLRTDVLAKVTFSDNFITKIGDNCFYGFNKLQNVTLSSSITKIGSSAFSSCSQFVGTPGKNNMIDLNNVKEIGSSAFSNCEKLTGFVATNNKLTNIGDSAFGYCSKLNTITLPSTVQSIGTYAFSGSSIQTFDFGTTKPVLGESVFSGCGSLMTVKANGSKTNTIPEVSVVGANLFSGCSKLTSFEIPSTLSEVANGMFSGCTNLASVTFKDSSKSNCGRIGDSAFNGCSGLTSIEIPQNTTVLGDYAFNECKKLASVKVSDKLAAMGNNCFSGCWQLSIAPYSKTIKKNTVQLPDTITAIPAGCFSGDSGLISVVLGKDSKVSIIGSYAFSNCTSLPSIELPSAVTEIYDSVFSNCSKLESVKYSNDLLVIHENAFNSCTSLKTMTPYGATVSNNTITFSQNTATVENNAFTNCTSFKYIKFLGGDNSNFANMGTYAFSGCTSLEGSTVDGTSSTLLEFPKGVVSIDNYVFQGCTKLANIEFKGDITSIGTATFDGCTGLKTVKVNDTLTSIGANAFSNCTSLTATPSLTKLTVLNSSTFENCSSLTSVTIPSGMERIESNAFANCTKLKSVSFSGTPSVETIGESAFSGCSLLSTISFPNSLVSMGNSAFAGTALKTITFNNGSKLDTTGDATFSNCTKLTSVDLTNTKLDKIGANIFAEDTALTSVELPSTLVTISDYAFSGCTKLSTINSTVKGTYDLPASVNSIGDYAFQNNYCLATMKIPAETDHINISAWSIELQYTQDDIDKGKFNLLQKFIVDSNNPNYASVDGVLFNKDKTELLRYPCRKSGSTYTVPSTVKTLGNSCFSSNDLVKKVIIPSSVETIKSYSFNYCGNLTMLDFSQNMNVNFEDYAIVTNNTICIVGKQNSTAKALADANPYSFKFVSSNQETKSITFKQGTTATVSMKSGTTEYQLTPILKTASGAASVDIVTYKSSNDNVATVDNDGRISLRGDGTAVITATTSGGLTAKFTLKVSNKVFLKDCTVTLAKKTYTCTGKAIKPTVTVVNGWEELAKSNYTVKYSANTSVGIAKVVITGKGSASGSVTRYFKIIPAKPTKVKFASAGTKSVKLTWAKSKGAKAYEVYMYKNKKWVKVKKTTAASCTISGLKSATVYKFKIKAYNGKYYSAASGTVSTTTKPVKVTVKTVNSAKKKTVKATWKKSTGVSGYQVQICAKKTFKGAKTVSTKAVSKSFTGLKSKKIYYVRVRAFKTLGGKKYYGAWSVIKKVKAK